jgi:ubiquinone biosynthesis monooxygenase Coq7
MSLRRYSLLDRFITGVDHTLKAITGTMPEGQRPNPADKVPEAQLNCIQKGRIRRLMRVNHVGEVCAQSLYQGQALTARSPKIKAALKQSAIEENDHLYWCQSRIKELNGHVSYLNPIWYAGALGMGIVAGLAGDRWNLGFLAATEQQVAEHLQRHINKLPTKDSKSLAILKQMKVDELHHADTAIEHGGAELPQGIKVAMSYASKIMTRTAYWI